MAIGTEGKKILKALTPAFRYSIQYNVLGGLFLYDPTVIYPKGHIEAGHLICIEAYNWNVQ